MKSGRDGVAWKLIYNKRKRYKFTLIYCYIDKTLAEYLSFYLLKFSMFYYTFLILTTFIIVNLSYIFK